MNTLRRISSNTGKALAAVAVLMAAALPLAIATTASASGPTITEIATTTGSVNLNTGIGVGADGIGVTVTGTGFTAPTGSGTLSLSTTAAGVTFAGSTYVGATSLTDAISVGATAVPGFYPLTVTDNGLTYTLANAFAVDAAPTVTSVSPTSVPQTGSNIPVTITGTGFHVTAASQVVFTDAAGGPITFALTGTPTSTNISGTVTTSNSAGGAASLVITNTDLGTVTDASAFTVNAPAPATISPNSISDPTSGNSYTQAFTVTGSGFVSGAVVTSNLTALAFGTSTVASGGASLTVSATVSNGTIGAYNITVTNPDGSTGTATGILGFGELPPAPSVTSTTNAIAVGATTHNTETLTAANGETFGTGATVTFTGTNITGVVTPTSATSATVTITVPAFQASTALAAATTTTSHTTITVGTGLNIAVGTVLTIVDGASTEQVTSSGYNATTGVVTIGASTVAHASGTVVEIPQIASITQFTVVGATGEAAIVDAQTILLTATNNAWTGATPATGTIVVGATTPVTLTFAGFNFGAGATATNISTTGLGVTGTVAVTSGGLATLNVTTPATQPGFTTLDVLDGATTAGDTWIHVASLTGITAGEVLTIASDTGTTNTEQVTVANTFVPTETTLGNGFLVPLTTALRFTHTTAADVTGPGLTSATPGSAAIKMLVTNGAGLTTVVNLTTAPNAVAAPTTEATISIGQGATTLSETFTGWAGVSTTVAQDVVTSSNTSVTFGAVTAATSSTFTVPVSVAAGATLSAAVPVTLTLSTGLGAGTDPAGLAIVAAPTVTSDTGTTTVTLGSVVTITANGTGFATAALTGNTATSTTVTVASTSGLFVGEGVSGSGVPAGDTIASIPSATTFTLAVATGSTVLSDALTLSPSVAFMNGTTVDTGIAAYGTVVSGTQLTVKITAVGAGALGGSDTLVVTNPNGGVGSLANALTVTAPVIISAAATTTGSLTSYEFDGGVTLTGTGFTPGTLSTSFTTGTTSSTTYVSPTSVTFSVASNTAAVGSTVTITLTDNGQTASYQFVVAAAPTVSAIAPTSTSLTGIAIGSASVPVTITGTGFLPGATVTFANSGVTGVVTSVTPFNIYANVSVSATASTGTTTVTVRNANGGTVTSSATLSITAAPTITSATQLLSGAATTMTITGTGFLAGAVVTSSNPSIVTFGTATVNAAGTAITVTATPTTFSGATALTANLIVTNPTGAGSVTDTNGLVINPGPVVTGTYYIPTFSSNIEYNVSGSGFEQGMTATSSNSAYTVSVASVNLAGSVATLLATTSSAATAGTSSQITFTNPDGGTVTFALNGGPVPTVTKPPVRRLGINGLHGTILTGRTVTIIITGTGFYGQPRIVSNAVGTFAHVAHDNGTRLVVIVTVHGNKRGVHTFTITLSNGQSVRVNYSQH